MGLHVPGLDQLAENVAGAVEHSPLLVAAVGHLERLANAAERLANAAERGEGRE